MRDNKCKTEQKSVQANLANKESFMRHLNLRTIEPRNKEIVNKLTSKESININEHIETKKIDTREENNSSRLTITLNSLDDDKINSNSNDIESNTNILNSLFKNLKGWISKINESARVNLDENFGNTLYNLNKSYENFSESALKELSEKWKDNSKELQSINENKTISDTRIIQFQSNENINKNSEFTKLNNLYNKDKYCNRNKYKNNKFKNLCNIYLEINKDRLDEEESLAIQEDSRTANQLAGQTTCSTRDARERADTKSGHKETIQDGGHSRVIQSTQKDSVNSSKRVPEKMESESERKQRHEKEDELVYDYLTDVTLQAVQKERDDRLKMIEVMRKAIS